MSKRIIALLLVMGCLPQTASWAADPVAGKEKARLCFDCHGVDGHSLAPNVPKLSGQQLSYIVTETIEFQKGIRRDPTMNTVSNQIKTLQDLEDIAAYFSSQKPMSGKSTDDELFKQGEALFTSAKCNYCHGEGGKQYSPFLASPPVIGGQHKTYLLKALTDIKVGNRPGDVYGLMKKLLVDLSDEKIEALAEYLSGV